MRYAWLRDFSDRSLSLTEAAREAGIPRSQFAAMAKEANVIFMAERKRIASGVLIPRTIPTDPKPRKLTMAEMAARENAAVAERYS